jgi:hypothetical protein
MRVTFDPRPFDAERGLDRSRGPAYGEGERFIVKVQIAMAGEPSVLVYDHAHRVEYVAGRAHGAALVRHVGGEPKSYWWATQNADGTVELGIEATWQAW